MKSIKVEDIIRMLEHIIQRPFLYVGTQPLAVIAYLNGFNTILGYLGFTPPRSGYDELYKSVVIERGWEYDAGGPWHQMQKKGMTDEEVIKETISIEIEYWKRTMFNSS